MDLTTERTKEHRGGNTVVTGGKAIVDFVIVDC
jgi:hypothetical protein